MTVKFRLVVLIGAIVAINGCSKNNLDILKSFSVSQTGANPRYYERLYSVDSSYKNIIFRVAKTYRQQDTILKLDVFLPNGDTNSVRPTIMFIHGGGFTGGSEKDGYARQICDSMTRRGYVTILIGYRLGYDWSHSTTTQDSIQKRLEAAYRADQDARAALRYIKQNALTGKIDTTKIFVAGVSAGAATALDLAYLDQNELDPSFISANGKLDSNGVYDYPNHSSKSYGIINLEGALFDTAWMKAGDTPFISLYGTNDNYYKVSGVETSPPNIPFFGALGIKSRADHLGISNNIHTNPGDHGSVYNSANIAGTIAFIRDALITQL